MPFNLSYGELQRVAKLLDQFAAECLKEALNEDLPIEDRTRWLMEALSYETSADRLRKVQLTDTG